MNRKQLLIIVAGLVLVGGVSLLINREDSQSWRTTEVSKLLKFDLNEVSRINLRHASGELNLVKKGEGQDVSWVVKERADYPADYQKVSDLVRKMWELKPTQTLKVGASQLGRLDLNEPGKGAASLLSLKDKEGKVLASLTIGKQHMNKPSEAADGMPGYPTGRYVMDEAKNVSLLGDALSELLPGPENWLDTTFLNISNIRSVAVSGTSGAWKLLREKDSEWKLDGAAADEQLDPAQTSGLGTLLASSRFADVAPETEPMTQSTAALIETSDGFTYSLTIGAAMDDKHPVKVAVSGSFAQERAPGKEEKPEEKAKLDEAFQKQLKELQDKLAKEQKFQQRIYLVEKYALGALTKERKELLKAPEPSPTPTATPAAKPDKPAKKK